MMFLVRFLSFVMGLWMLAAFLGWVLQKGLIRSSKTATSAKDPNRDVTLVPCGHCNIYIDKENAFVTKHGFFCSPEHAKGKD